MTSPVLAGDESGAQGGRGGTMSDKNKIRTGEDEKKRHFRSDRISMANGKFFFTTREGTLEGPFSTREDAERELMMFMRRVSGKGIYGSVIHDDPPKK